MDIQYLYNTIAVMCDKICSLDKESETKLYRSYWSNVRENTRKLYIRFPFLNPDNPSDTILDDINEDQWDDLLMYIEESAKIDLTLLACLDRIVDLDVGLRKYFSSSEYDINKFTALNNNFDVCAGKLIPKYTPKWKKTKERSTSELGEKALSILTNYLWIKNSDDNGWEVSNFYSYEWEYGGKAPFRIICSPLVNMQNFDYTIETVDTVKYFYINYFDDMKDIVTKRVERVIEYATEQEADVVLFPEIVADPDLHKRIKNYVNNRWDAEYPKIMFLPSSEHNRDGQWKDKTYAISSSGSDIFECCKQHPYQLDIKKRIGNREVKVKCFEPIQANHKISLIHYKGVGRIGVCICSDLFCDELMKLLLKTYNIDLLLILSYSDGRDRFERSISIARDTVCDVVWCNCCAAYINPEKKIFVKNREPAVSYFPFGHANLRKVDDYTLLYRCSNSECEACSECIKIIEINSSYG